MNQEEAKRLIREIAKTGWIRLTTHCRQRMQERGVHMDDLMQSLLWGEVTELQENPGCQNWECRISGHDLEGDPLIVMIAILEGDFAVLCITVHG